MGAKQPFRLRQEGAGGESARSVADSGRRQRSTENGRQTGSQLRASACELGSAPGGVPGSGNAQTGGSVDHGELPPGLETWQIETRESFGALAVLQRAPLSLAPYPTLEQAAHPVP